MTENTKKVAVLLKGLQEKGFSCNIRKKALSIIADSNEKDPIKRMEKAIKIVESCTTEEELLTKIREAFPPKE